MYLSGVGPRKKEILSKELGVNTYRDLLEYYPYKYVDRTKVYLISELVPICLLFKLKAVSLALKSLKLAKERNELWLISAMGTAFATSFGLMVRNISTKTIS